MYCSASLRCLVATTAVKTIDRYRIVGQGFICCQKSTLIQLKVCSCTVPFSSMLFNYVVDVGIQMATIAFNVRGLCYNVGLLKVYMYLFLLIVQLFYFKQPTFQYIINRLALMMSLETPRVHIPWLGNSDTVSYLDILLKVLHKLNRNGINMNTNAMLLKQVMKLVSAAAPL